MRKPNFFIIGAPKCGTTALSEYLRTHPKVFISEPKEPQYFNTDINLTELPKGIRNYRSIDDYLLCFKGATTEHLAVGEASPLYLYSEIAVENILRFNSDARFIVMLRNPIDLVHSLHSEFVYAGYEDQDDFNQAWYLQEQRSRGDALWSPNIDAKILLYGEVAKLGKQLTRLFSIVDHKLIKLIFFDDFSNHTQKIYQETLQFLDVPDDRRADFPIINKNKNVQSAILHYVLTHLDHSAIVRLPVLFLKRILKISSLGLTRRLLLSNTRPMKRPPLPSLFRQELEQFFSEDQILLESLLSQISGRD